MEINIVLYADIITHLIGYADSLNDIFNMLLTNRHWYQLMINNKFLVEFNKFMSKIKKLDDCSYYNFRSACQYGLELVAQYFYDKLDLDVYSNNYIFCVVCEYGQIGMAKWLIQKYIKTDSPINIHFNDNHPFGIACEKGHTGTAKFLVEISNKTESPISKNQQIIGYAFRMACFSGHLDTAEWLINLCGIIDSFFDNNINRYYDIFRTACLNDIFGTAYLNSYMEIIMMLVQLGEKLSLPNNYTMLFDIACKNNHMGVAKLLLEISKEKKSILDIHYKEDNIFLSVCANCDTEMVKWLLDIGIELGLPFDINTGNGKPFRLACKNGGIGTAKLLFRLGKERNTPFNINIKSRFKNACFYNRVGLAAWLFKISIEIKSPIDIHAEDDDVLKMCCTYGAINTVKWLVCMSIKLNSPFNDDTYRDASNLAHDNNHKHVTKWLKKSTNKKIKIR
jgi:hypothetical protein